MSGAFWGRDPDWRVRGVPSEQLRAMQDEVVREAEGILAEPAPVPAERIPNANTPVRLSEVRQQRASFVANVTAGAVLIVLCLGGIGFYFVSGLAS
jgi:hypothetical protein